MKLVHNFLWRVTTIHIYLFLRSRSHFCKMPKLVLCPLFEMPMLRELYELSLFAQLSVVTIVGYHFIIR